MLYIVIICFFPLKSYSYMRKMLPKRMNTFGENFLIYNMTKSFKMSLFMPPISPVKDEATGKTMKNATLTPLRTLELNEVYQLITANKRLLELTEAIRESARQGDENNCRMLKQQTLPYVTPCGVFTRRRSDCLKEPSGLVVVDIDHLESPEEAENLKRQLFDDAYLQPVLVFVSPTGHGVKAFVPCPSENMTEGVRWAMNYIHCLYDADHPLPGKGVDTSGKDPVRACFLCHDARALLRET